MLYMYFKSSLLVSIPNDVRTDLLLSSTSDSEKSVQLYEGFHGSEKKTKKKQRLNLYTQTKVKQHHIFFRKHCFERFRTEYVGMEIKYFEFNCKFYYFYEHLELKMIWSTKYLESLRPFTKQVKNDKEKQ